MISTRLIFACCMALTASQAQAGCGFCAEEVILSEDLAKCYLDRKDEELAAAVQEQAEIHLVDLSICNADNYARSATALPDVKTDGEQTLPPDEAFLIPVPALECLAREVENATFEPDTPLVFEVRVDC